MVRAREGIKKGRLIFLKESLHLFQVAGDDGVWDLVQVPQRVVMCLVQAHRRGVHLVQVRSPPPPYLGKVEDFGESPRDFGHNPRGCWHWQTCSYLAENLVIKKYCLCVLL